MYESLTVTGHGTLRGPDQSQDTIQLGHTTVTHNGMHKTYHKPRVKGVLGKIPQYNIQKDALQTSRADKGFIQTVEDHWKHSQ